MAGAFLYARLIVFGGGFNDTTLVVVLPVRGLHNRKIPRNGTTIADGRSG